MSDKLSETTAEAVVRVEVIRMLEALPAEAVGSYGISWDYGQLVREGMGVEVLAQENIGSYQGDTLMVVTDGAQFGYLEFGWGSCSGCDALEACRGLSDLTELRDSLYADIHWEPSREALAEWMKARDWQGQWLFKESGAMEFVRASVDLLQSPTSATATSTEVASEEVGKDSRP